MPPLAENAGDVQAAAQAEAQALLKRVQSLEVQAVLGKSSPGVIDMFRENRYAMERFLALGDYLAFNETYENTYAEVSSLAARTNGGLSATKGVA